MRNPAIVATCMLLVATLVSPGMAMAKGGNGQHSKATPEASDTEKPDAGKGKAEKPDAGTKARQSAKPKAASHQASTKKKAVKKPTGKAPKIAATKKIRAAQKPRSATPVQPAKATPAVAAIPVSRPSAVPADGGVSSDAIEASDMGTRGVLDTIRVKLSTSLAGMRASFAAMWSTLNA